MKIFIGLHNIAGYYGPLAKGFRELGQEVSEVYEYDHKFGYETTNVGKKIVKIFTAMGNKRMAVTRENLIRKVFYKGCQIALIPALFVWALCNHDVFIFSFASQFFPGDLRILKCFRKKIIRVYHGSDSRPPYLDGWQYQRFNDEASTAFVKLTRAYARRMRRDEELSDAVISLPATSQFMSKKNYSFLSIGIPCIPRTKKSTLIRRSQGCITRILHAPSNLEAKGTNEIRKIVEELIEEGLKINYVEISGKSNLVVHQELEKSDLVIDQLYSDSPMAGLAAEAAAHGVPVITAGFHQEETRKMHQKKILPPTVYCDPVNFKEELRKLVVDITTLEHLSQLSSQFVEKQWHYKIVAQRFVDIVNNTADINWLFNPLQLCRPIGGGASLVKTHELLDMYIKKHGVSNLCADHNVHWKNSLVRFAQSGLIQTQPTLRPDLRSK